MTAPKTPRVPPPPVLGGGATETSEQPAASPAPSARAEAQADDGSTGPTSNDAPVDDAASSSAAAGEDAGDVRKPSGVGPEGGATPPQGETFGSLIDVLHAQLGRTPEVPAPIQASRRRGALPPPKAEATRASYSAGRPDPHERPAPAGVHALPSGVRPPAAPDPLEPDDTGVLIASAVAALTSGDTDPSTEDSGSLASAHSTPPADATGAAQPLAASAVTTEPTPEVARPAATAGVAPIPESSDPSGGKRVWIAAAAAVAAVAVLWWLWPSGSQDDASPDPIAKAAVSQASVANDAPGGDAGAAVSDAARSHTADADADADADHPAAHENRDPAAAGSPPHAAEDPLPAEPPSDVDMAVADDAVPQDDSLLHDGQPDDDLAQAQEDTAADVEDTQVQTKASRPRKRKKAKGAPKPAPSSTPASAPPAEKDGATLLAEAKAALTAGKHQSAYRLASKAAGKGQRSGALVIMAKAACRMGSEPKAKQAFGQMTMSQRRGIRSECRAKGIRLGL